MTRITLLRTGALAAASLAALTLPAQADRGRDTYRGGHDGAILHSDAGFSGEALRIDGAVPDLARLRFNGRVSSITIRSGVWEVCTDANFRGRCETMDTSVARLKGLRLNDNISSIRPAGYGRAGHRGNSADVVLFSKAGLRGDPMEINGNVPDLAAYRFNDRASSILVTRGTWLACEHANYKGRCEVIPEGSGDLRPIGLNDNISSIRRYDRAYQDRNGPGRQGWPH